MGRLGRGMVGMAGCGVMELWGMAHSGAMGPQGCGSFWGDGAVGYPTVMELWGMAHSGVMELWGMACFGVMEPLWAGWGHGIMGMAGCGVMDLWGVL